MSSSNCCFLTCIQVSQEAGQVVWHSHLLKNFPQFVVIHTVKGFNIVSEAEVDVFLELSCFFEDPTDVGNLISGSSAFSKSSLNIWKFLVHVMVKPSMQDFKHDLTSMGCYCCSVAQSCPTLCDRMIAVRQASLSFTISWNLLKLVSIDCNWPMVSTFFGTTLLGNWDEIDLFQSCGHCWVFQICWHNECKTLIASSFKGLNSSAGISLHPLALLTAVLLKAYLTAHSRMSGSEWLTTPSWLSNSLRYFCIVLPRILSISSWPLQHLLDLCCFCLLLCPSLGKMFFDISNFPEEISSFSPFVVFFCC